MPLTADRPKALVEVGGRSLLARMVEACAAAGMTEVIIVTGYKHAAIDAALPGLALPAVTVFNDAFDTRGNAWSLYVARDAIGGRDFVKLDGDVLLDTEILSTLLANPAASAIVLDDRAALDDEAMKARVSNGRVEALGKWLSIDESAGESIGIEKIAAADAPALFAAIEAVVADAPMAYYEDVYHWLVERGWNLGAAGVGAHRWTEIDDRDDLARAERLVE
jgi:choline kinase